MAKRFKGYYNSRFSQYIDDPSDKVHISRSTSYRRRKRQARSQALATTAATTGGMPGTTSDQLLEDARMKNVTYDLVDAEHSSDDEEPNEVSDTGEGNNFLPNSHKSDSPDGSFSDLDDFADNYACDSDNSEDSLCADAHQEDVFKNDSIPTTTEKDSNDGKFDGL